MAEYIVIPSEKISSVVKGCVKEKGFETEIEGVKIIEPDVFGDHRGELYEW